MSYPKALAKQCEKNKRWSFFFTSSPINSPGMSRPIHQGKLAEALIKVVGGVASLANAMAIH